MKSSLRPLLWGLCSASFACSPMYQSVYEGDVQFEHCYRVDEERAVAVSDKLQCWREWGRRYSYGQSRDRIGYAHARERTLSEPMAGRVAAAPRGADAGRQSLPQPVNAFAPPPQTMKSSSSEPHALAGDDPQRARPHVHSEDGGIAYEPQGSPTDAGAVLAFSDAPGATCGASCGKSWTECTRLCKRGSCSSGCEDRYRSCMRACF